MATLLTRRSGPAALALTAFTALIIGCGGGGGGGGNGGPGGGPGGGSGVTDGTTSGDSGLSGVLPQNKIFYAEGSAGGTTYDVKYVNPDGTGGATFLSGIDSQNSAAVADPDAAGQFVFALQPSGSTLYGIYRNSTISTTGATTIVAPAYSSVSSLQIAGEGSEKKIVFIATVGDPNTAPLRLYQSATAAGSSPLLIDDAYAATLSGSGDRVVYNKYPSDNDNDTELYVRRFSEISSHRLTDNSLNEEDPQFSKDGSLVVFAQDVPSSLRIRLASINLATGVVTTIDPSPTIDNLRAPTLNAAGDKIAYVGISNGDASQSGIYVADFPSGANASAGPIVTSANLQNATYWSTPQGRSLTGGTLRLSVPRKR